MAFDFNEDFNSDFNISLEGDFNGDFNSDFNISTKGDFNGDFNSDFSTTLGSSTVINVPTGLFTLGLPTPEIIVGTIIDTPSGVFSLTPLAPTVADGTVTINVPVGVLNLQPQAPQVYQLNIINWNGSPAPVEHINDSKELEADGYVELFEITLADKFTKLYLKENDSLVWQGNLYEGTGIKLTNVATYSDDQTARPKLTLFNPEGVYSYLIDQQLLDNAVVARIRVLKSHIDNDQPVSRSQQWKVSRVASLRRNIIGIELRDMLDGQFFLAPGRMFIPPEFPQVNLG